MRLMWPRILFFCGGCCGLGGKGGFFILCFYHTMLIFVAIQSENKIILVDKSGKVHFNMQQHFENG